MKGKPKALTPKLRFPEFKSPWELKKISPYLQECSSRVSAPTSLPIYTSSRAGLKPQEDYYSGRTIMNDGEYGVVPPECFVFRHMSDDGRFAFNINETGGDIAVSKEYPVFRAVGLDRHFLLAKLNHSPDFKAFALSQKAGGTRTRLYFSNLSNWETMLPLYAEQRKIAECLTSLDECIAAEGRRLESLRAHKKGLMQQLFPREGETRPSLRFPEFRDAGEWEGRRIRDLLEKVALPIEVEAEQTYREIGVRSHGKGIFHKDEVKGSTIGTKRVFRVVEDAFVLNIVFAWEQAVAFTTKAETGMIASHRFPMFLPKENACDVRFITLACLTPVGKQLLGLASPGGAGRNRTLGQDEFDKVEIVVPEKDEQTRIADVVLSADALVAAQSRKLDGLRAHKKGLMQQLFPSREDAEE